MSWLHRFIVSLLAAAFLQTVAASQAQADELKRQICALGINLGSIASREYFFGRAFSTGQPPADQVADIAVNVGNILAHAAAAEGLITTLQPPGRRETVRQFTTEISAYMGARVPLNYTQRENRVANLAGRYRQSLEWTYNSARPDSFQYQPNCDSFLFTACYQFGYAATAAAVGDTSNQNGRVGAMRSAVRSGMSLAFDRERQSNAEQVCCNMGSEALWAPILAMTGTSPHSLFVTNTDTIQAIALSIPPAQCTAGHARNYVGCYAEDRRAELRGLGNRVLGGAMIPDHPAMTIDMCVGFCGSKGFAYAGVQYSKWCFCGNSYADRGEAKNCNMACSGDRGKTCGGAWANSVYRTSAQDSFSVLNDSSTVEANSTAPRRNPATNACPTTFGNRFSEVRNAGIPGHNVEVLGPVDLDSCKTACLERGWCRSVDYERSAKRCFLQDVNGCDAQLNLKYPGNPYDHYFREALN